MGTAIALMHAARSIPVVLIDKNSEALRRAATTAGELANCEWNGNQRSPRLPLKYGMTANDLDGCDLVLESIVEKRLDKQAVYGQINTYLTAETILTTNTSTIPIAQLAAGLAEPGRFCGVHFCHPVWLRPLVEVIPGPATSDETVAAVVAHVCSLGKLPLVVADGPGFVVNRLLMASLNAAMEMVLEGVPIPRIDAAMVDFGMPIGPLQLLDEIGLDTALQSGVVLAEASGKRSKGSELLVKLVKDRQYGTKAGAGFYNYPERTPNPTCERIVANLRTSDIARGEALVEHAMIAEAILEPMVAEAAGILEEKRAVAAWQIDLAMVFGIGFPFWRGGPLWWATQTGNGKAKPR